MQELNMVEVDEVGGGFGFLVMALIIAAIYVITDNGGSCTADGTTLTCS